MARPTTYKEEYAQQAMYLTELGAIDKDLARAFSVTEATIGNWKKKYPKFLAALTKGKTTADEAVVRALFQRATGYQHAEDKMFCYEGVVVTEETIKHFPPDTAACIFWLKNRRSEEWRDKPEGSDNDELLAATLKFIATQLND